MPIQINQELCLRCERCLRACRNKAIYFENGIRLVDYSKCKGCLGCVLVCPRNAIEVTSVFPKQILTIKIDHDKCNLCLNCVNENSKFCPQRLFYIDKIQKDGKSIDGIRYKFTEISKCQGCAQCEFKCPEKAIKLIKYETEKKNN